MPESSITIRPENDGFLLEATDGNQTVVMHFEPDVLCGWSLGIAQSISAHEQRRQSESHPLPILDIVSSDISFGRDKVGVVLTIRGHRLAPVKLTFPIHSASVFIRDFVDELSRAVTAIGG
jgi:hypothetical protein